MCRNIHDKLWLCVCVRESCDTQLPNGKQSGLICVVEHLLEKVNTWEITHSVCMFACWENWSFLTCFDELERRFYCRIQKTAVDGCS